MPMGNDMVTTDASNWTIGSRTTTTDMNETDPTTGVVVQTLERTGNYCGGSRRNSERAWRWVASGYANLDLESERWRCRCQHEQTCRCQAIQSRIHYGNNRLIRNECVVINDAHRREQPSGKSEQPYR
jgi:hypothetical protein